MDEAFLRAASGDLRALSRALTVVENRRDGWRELLKAAYRSAGKARIIGVTGPPGAGKSTLVNALVGCFRSRELRVAVVAVDPSSAFSGGAILGDRIRMQDRALDEGVFIRSMATRGHMGGLARATDDVVTVLDGAGFDVVIVETVGVGQDEVDIVREAGTVLVVLVPGMGDDIQAIKAGIMEIADIFVLNKADREGVERLEREVESMLALASEPRAWVPPVVRTIASKGVGVEELVAALDHHHSSTAGTEEAEERRRQKLLEKFWDLLQEGFREAVSNKHLPSEKEAELSVSLLRREADPYTAAERLLGAALGNAATASRAHMDHVGVAVADLASARKFFEDLGLACSGEETVADQGVRVAFLPVGESRIELLHATDPGGPIGKFLSKKGPGLHHLSLCVPDLEAALAALQAKGYDLIDAHPRVGAGGHRIAFVHPRSTGGVLLELCEGG